MLLLALVGSCDRNWEYLQYSTADKRETTWGTLSRGEQRWHCMALPADGTLDSMDMARQNQGVAGSRSTNHHGERTRQGGAGRQDQEERRRREGKKELGR